MLEQELLLEQEDRIAKSTMNNLYRHARCGQWTAVERDLQLVPEQAKYVHLDGTTTLHLAVMSRTGYVLDTSTTQQQQNEGGGGVCPLAVLEWICQYHPQAANQACHINSYTPLAYACLVASGNTVDEDEDEHDSDDSSDDDDHPLKQRQPSYSLEDAQDICRILLKYAPDCTKVFTAGGLSALDVHVVSYSQRRNQKGNNHRRRRQHQKNNKKYSSNASTDERSLILTDSKSNKEEETTHHHPLTGRTNTLVIRTLLEADPTLAHVRISKDRVTGPVELLYRCNSADFLTVVSQDEMKELGKKRGIEKEDSSRKMRKNLMSHWWVWRWTILILKYGTVPFKKRGAKFSCLQAAAGLVGCPLPILTLAMNAFPSQIRELDEMHHHGRNYTGVGNLPLHEVCSWPCAQEDVASTDPVIPSRKGMAIAALLGEYPQAAKMVNAKGQTPLELAVESGTTWDSGVRKLVRAHPAAVSKRSTQYANFYPFLCAAVAAGESSKRQEPLPSSKRSLMSHLKNVSKQDLQFVRTIYGLLRANPLVLMNVVAEGSRNNEQERLPTNWEAFPLSQDAAALWASSVQLQLQEEDSTQWTDFGRSSGSGGGGSSGFPPPPPSSPSTTTTTTTQTTKSREQTTTATTTTTRKKTKGRRRTNDFDAEPEIL